MFVVMLGLLTLASPYSSADTPKTRWENYVSRRCTFTLLKPAGWIVKENYQDNPRMWAFSVTEPNGSCQVTSAHGASPTGRDGEGEALIRAVMADLFKQAPGLQLAPTARRRKLDLVDATGKKTGEKIIVIFEGTYTNQQNQKRQFRSLVTGGDGLMLNQRIEAAEGHLAGASGYVRGDPSGLYTAEGNKITSEPYGESNTRQLYEQIRPH